MSQEPITIKANDLFNYGDGTIVRVAIPTEGRLFQYAYVLEVLRGYTHTGDVINERFDFARWVSTEAIRKRHFRSEAKQDFEKEILWIRAQTPDGERHVFVEPHVDLFVHNDHKEILN